VNQEELDFVAWMDNVDLEEVNLLDVPPESRDDFDAEARTKKDEGPTELPPHGDIGWDVE
jgi:hypothetical protein